MCIDEKLLHLDTEKPGLAYPHRAQEEIQLRYSFACQFVSEKRVVEVGYGAGYGIVDLASRAGSYFGVDLLESNKALAEDRLLKSGLLDRAEVICGEATNIPISNDNAEVLIAFAMIYYVDAMAFFSEVHRVLKPKGTFVFCQTNPSVINFSPSRNTVRYYTRQQLINLLKESGFSCNIYGIPELNEKSAKIIFVQRVKELIKKLAPRIYSQMRKKLVKYEMLPEHIAIDEAEPMLEKLRLVSASNEERVRILFVVATKLS